MISFYNKLGLGRREGVPTFYNFADINKFLWMLLTNQGHPLT